MPKLVQKAPNSGVKPHTPPRVVALIYDGLCTFEYGIVAEIFGLSRPELGGDLFQFSSVASEGKQNAAAGGLIVQATGTEQDLTAADIIVVPGWRGKDAPVPTKTCKLIRQAHARGAVLFSICSGIYVLAAAGVLSERNATTHWRYIDDFARKYPDVTLRPNELYVDEGNIITSAGSSAGIDASVHIVRNYYGAEVANSVARRLVMHGHRHGGQAQFIEQPVAKPDGSHRLSDMMDQVRSSLDAPHRIASMAQLAGMSPRTFQRQFQNHSGQSAMQWLARERVARACQLLETTAQSVDVISQTVGFESPDRLRYHFRSFLDVSPVDYRKSFRRSA
ncbi:transcriptional regulator FtrA [Sedimentitalea sp. CY04]|uniref:Transcriptional regulator FtrA n=1 Tax=Parasedimentitalea denitrificans TaxID=2211118 RepID=A0ABX0W7E8_9RHOB|nr:transcriptional regulator FtrA [Sedimentitalea sp. CY04]NIZ60091.1 transcriptional regulator FtrA [Sedimentitalea sp. CY04]